MCVLFAVACFISLHCSSAVQEKLSKASPVGLLKVMAKYGCSPDEHFVFTLLHQPVATQNYDGARVSRSRDISFFGGSL